MDGPISPYRAEFWGCVTNAIMFEAYPLGK